MNKEQLEKLAGIHMDIVKDSEAIGELAVYFKFDPYDTHTLEELLVLKELFGVEDSDIILLDNDDDTEIRGVVGKIIIEKGSEEETERVLVRIPSESPSNP